MQRYVINSICMLQSALCCTCGSIIVNACNYMYIFIYTYTERYQYCLKPLPVALAALTVSMALLPWICCKWRSSCCPWQLIVLRLCRCQILQAESRAS